jgi:catechol 2,3-dioxygenase-like lactoylglutathione lyase family enzyme
MIDHLDHLVLTTADEAACVDFYTRVLGMALETFVGGTPPMARKAFTFGAQKINLHVKVQRTGNRLVRWTCAFWREFPWRK